MHCRLSKLYHPDVNKDTEAAYKFNQISNAYEVLISISKRKLYDREHFFHAVHYQEVQHDDLNYAFDVDDTENKEDKLHTWQGFYKYGSRLGPPPRGKPRIIDTDSIVKYVYMFLEQEAHWAKGSPDIKSYCNST